MSTEHKNGNGPLVVTPQDMARIYPDLIRIVSSYSTKLQPLEEIEEISEHALVNTFYKVNDKKITVESDEKILPVLGYYACRAARNRIIDIYRKEGETYHDEYEDSSIGSREPRELRPVENYVIEKILAEEANKLIKELPQPERQVVEARIAEESYEHLAKNIGKTQVATRLINHRGLQKIKNKLEIA